MSRQIQHNYRTRENILRCRKRAGFATSSYPTYQQKWVWLGRELHWTSKIACLRSGNNLAVLQTPAHQCIVGKAAKYRNGNQPRHRSFLWTFRVFIRTALQTWVKHTAKNSLSIFYGGFVPREHPHQLLMNSVRVPNSRSDCLIQLGRDGRIAAMMRLLN
mgnify:CR=1 FL=1